MFLFNNSIIYTFYTFIIFEKKKNIFYKNTISCKNEINVWTTILGINYVLITPTFYTLKTFVDIVSTQGEKFETLSYYKIYNTINASYSNFYFINSTTSLSAFSKTVCIYERESSEFFQIKYAGIKDKRNLLLDYGLKIPLLIKKIPLELTNEIKKNENNSKFKQFCVDF